jgi:cell wall-associated NlpC family hydrolase
MCGRSDSDNSHRHRGGNRVWFCQKQGVFKDAHLPLRQNRKIRRSPLKKRILIAITLSLLISGFTSCKTQHRLSSQSQTDVVSLIHQEYLKWEGTPHKMGGDDYLGVDCSGFVHQLYNRVFDLKLPRSTQQLMGVGQEISRHHLKPGDLVFFRPPSSLRHVGIYIGNSNFIHTSSSEGVTTSDMNSNYWRKAYWMSRRVLN